MEIICKNCAHKEKTDLDFFVKLIGAALPFGGYWAWVTYLFAGTGFGIRIPIPMLESIRIDLAWGIRNKKFNDSPVLHFGIQQKF